MSDDEVFAKVLNYVNLKDGITILQFGVGCGNTLLSILRNLRIKNITPARVIGFDNFTGLPEEYPGVPKFPDWEVGAYNLISEINNQNLGQVGTQSGAMKKLLDRFSPYKDYTDFIIGYYSDTLNPRTSYEYVINKASFIDIDCDLFISAYQALDFLFYSDLLEQDCVIRYDDWVIPDIQEGEGGESKAHNEICRKYGAVFERLESTKNDAVFRYKGRK